MKRLQFILIFTVCLASLFAHAAPSASQHVRQRFDEALRNQIKQFLVASWSKKPPPRGDLTGEELDRETEVLTKKVLVRYGPAFMLQQHTAQALIAKGPNDTDNLAAVKLNWETYKKVPVPLPALLKYLHEQVDAGGIRKGWDLELARRISDAHLAEASDALRREEESQKKNSR